MLDERIRLSQVECVCMCLEWRAEWVLRIALGYGKTDLFYISVGQIN